MKPIRYSSTNGAINIGGRRHKLTIFTQERVARLHWGDRTFHIGDWDRVLYGRSKRRSRHR